MNARAWATVGFLVWATAVWAQPEIRWQRALGGAGQDQILRLMPGADGALLAFGVSGSETNTLKRAPRFGGLDFWVVALDAGGGVLWERTYGGTGWDELWSVAATADGGLLLGGTTSSAAGGTKTTGHFGHTDFWVTRTDAAGAPLWDRTFGGGQIDRLAHVEALTDGGFLLVGQSDSDLEGNKTAPSKGGQDGWVLRLDAHGDVVWQRTLGGVGIDAMAAARQLPDGSFLLVGHSDSPTGGDKNDGAHGLGDVWLVRLDSAGAKLWDRVYGGSNVEYAHDLLLLPGGDAVVLATSLSGISGNKTSPSRGGGAVADAYVIRVNDQGHRVWEQTFGGSGVDLLTGGVLADGGLLLTGESDSSPGGNKASPLFGWDDLWLARVDLDGRLLWETTLGSGGSERAHAVARMSDGDIVVAGHFRPINGLAPPVPTLGQDDAYLVRLADDRPRLRATAGPSFRLTLHGPTNTWHRTDISGDLKVWTPWRTNRLDGSPTELPNANGAPGQFFRASLMPAP